MAQQIGMEKGLGPMTFNGLRFAPSMLKPLKSAAELKSEIGLPEVWRNLMEIPIGEVIRNRFSDDLVQGVVLTDALIGTFVSADDMQANRCFPYHIIGNGNKQWCVPQGGMGALVKELHRIDTSQGVEIKLQSKVAVLESGPAGVRIETESGHSYIAKDLLFAAAPQHLARLRGCAIPGSLEGSDQQLWGAETDDAHIHLAGEEARHGGGVSGIAGHNAAMALLAKD